MRTSNIWVEAEYSKCIEDVSLNVLKTFLNTIVLKIVLSVHLLFSIRTNQPEA